MRVALVVPQTSLHLNIASSPLNLGYIASYLRKIDPVIDVKIFDGSANVDVKKALLCFKPDVVGVTATTPQILAAYELADWIKKSYPTVLTVIGGVHVSILPEEATHHFDVVVVGEGEKAFAKIVTDFKNCVAIKKIIYGEAIENLDDFPIPAYDLFDMTYYTSSAVMGWLSFYLPSPVATLISSRGCPYHCVFCYNSGRISKVRYHSARRIVNEILYLHNKYHINNFWFEDDEFLINFNRLRELKTVFKSENMDTWLKWGCQARVTTLTIPVLKLAKSMGCVLIVPGFESGCEKTLSYLKAGSVKLADNKKAILNARKVGMSLGGNFIVGTPFESLSEMKETLHFIEENDLAFAGVNVLTPYPGTALWRDCIKLGLIPKNISYDDLNSVSAGQAFTVSTIPKKYFNRFLIDLLRVNWFISAIHRERGFKGWLKLSRTKTFWYLWLYHPRLMIRSVIKRNLKKP